LLEKHLTPSTPVGYGGGKAGIFILKVYRQTYVPGHRIDVVNASKLLQIFNVIFFKAI
jgi:hypothetical protein